VRTSLALLAGLAIVSVASPAQASRSSLSISPSTYRVLYGHHITVAGRLSGGLPAGREVTVYAWRYGRSAPIRVGRIRTGMTGRWSLTVHPPIQTSYQARSSGVASPRVTVGVAPAVTGRELDNGRISVHVLAHRAFTGRMIQLQMPAVDGKWRTVDRKRLSSASIAVLAPSVGTSKIRLAFSVNQAGPGYLGSVSHPMIFRAQALVLTPSAFRVLYGHRLTLTGRLLNGHAGQRVSIVARQYGRSAPRLVARVKTTAGGRFSLRVKPRIMTAYQARLGRAHSSARIVVGVQPALTIRELRNGLLRTIVRAGKSFGGRRIELQRRGRNGSWSTIATAPLGPNSTAVLAIPLPTTTIRIAMSVNQAGRGYLGTSTHPLHYRSL